MSVEQIYASWLLQLAYDASIQGDIKIAWSNKTRWTITLNNQLLSSNLATTQAINVLITLASFQRIISATQGE